MPRVAEQKHHRVFIRFAFGKRAHRILQQSACCRRIGRAAQNGAVVTGVQQNSVVARAGHGQNNILHFARHRRLVFFCLRGLRHGRLLHVQRGHGRAVFLRIVHKIIAVVVGVFAFHKPRARVFERVHDIVANVLLCGCVVRIVRARIVCARLRYSRGIRVSVARFCAAAHMGVDDAQYEHQHNENCHHGIVNALKYFH